MGKKGLRPIPARDSDGLSLGGLRGYFTDSLTDIFPFKKSAKRRSHVCKILLCSMKSGSKTNLDTISVTQRKGIC